MSLNGHKFHWSFSYSTFFVETFYRTFYREEFLKMMLQCQHDERRKMGDRTFSSIDRAFKASAIVKIIRNSHIFRRQVPTCSQRYQDPRWYRYRQERSHTSWRGSWWEKEKKILLAKNHAFLIKHLKSVKERNLTNSSRFTHTRLTIDRLIPINRRIMEEIILTLINRR